MFGFLKKKLKEAVSKFSKEAEAEVVEEQVDDQAAVQEALVEEKTLLAAVEEPVEEIPELPKEKAEHEREAKEKKGFLAGIFGKKEPVKEAPKREGRTVEKPLEKKPVPEKPSRAPEKIVLVPGKRSVPVPEKRSVPETEPVVVEKRPAVPEKKILPEKSVPILEKKTPPEKAAPAKPVRVEETVVKKTPEKTVVPVPEIVSIPTKTVPVHETVSIPEKTPTRQGHPVAEQPEKRGFFSRLKETFTKKTLSGERFETLFWELEVTLLENNVAVEVIEKLKEDLKEELTSGKVSRLGVEDLILLTLKKSVEEVLDIPGFDLLDRIKSSKRRPYVIAFIGVNGSGKTTTLAKVANLFQNEGLSVVMAASDTFRAAAIDQLKEHADTLGIKLISQGYGADPAAVAFDAIEHAKAKGIDVVMIDTAGRLHSNTNLMAELQKVVRVAKPDLKIFIGESITGNDCVEQAKEFDRLVGIDALILSKADVDEKGGAALSVSYVTKRPILYLGVGQAYGDLKPFDKRLILKNLGL